jgi:hypothetical protein
MANATSRCWSVYTVVSGGEPVVVYEGISKFRATTRINLNCTTFDR